MHSEPLQTRASSARFQAPPVKNWLRRPCTGHATMHKSSVRLIHE